MQTKARIQRKEASWKPLIDLFRKSKLPWWLYILQVVFIYYLSQLSVYVIEIAGKIIAGEIQEPGLVNDYIYYSAIGLLASLAPLLSNYVNILFESKIQTATWKSFISLPIKVYERLVPSTLISRVTSDSVLAARIIDEILTILQILFSLYFSIEMMFSFSTSLTWVILAMVVFYSVLFVAARNWIFEITFMLQDALSMLTGFFSERLGNMKLMKASAAEEEEIKRGHELNEAKFQIDVSRIKYDTVLTGFQHLMRAILTGIVLVGGSVMVNEGTLQLEELISFYMFIAILPDSFQTLILMLLDMQGTKGATTAVAEITDLPAEQIKREVSMTGGQDITLKGVNFSYKEGEPILKDFSCHIPYGKMTAIVGPSGGGKTTVLKLLERFYEPDSGEIYLGDTEIKKIHLDDWRRKFGYVIQNSPLLSGTVKDNILYGANREVSEEELQEILKIANVDFLDELEDGINTHVGESGQKLSGGQRQRVAIARAIVNDAEFLLMDEATANLDAINELEITSSLIDLMKGKTIVVVAHNLKTIEKADNILVMEEGEIQDQGTHEELYQKSPLYRRMIDLQQQAILNE
ncbi:ABC transporter ATP-binding protein [Guggenheimella bovis]